MQQPRPMSTKPQAKRGNGHRAFAGAGYFSEKERGALQARAVPQDRQAALVDAVELGRVGRNDTLLEHQAAAEAPFAGKRLAI